jgi:hypothetical protein
MQKSFRLGLLVAAMIASATALWAATATYTPPPETGHIWTVINYKMVGGRNQSTSVNVQWDRPRRTIIVPGPSYASPCRTSTPAGFVLRLRHSTADSVPMTINTNGTVIRGPYQGEAPPEALHACYTLVKG